MIESEDIPGVSMKRNGSGCDSITVMGRPRRLDRVLTRSVGAAVPIEDADRMAELCARVGVSQSDVVRAAVYAFMAEHAAEESTQEVLPLREAS